MEMVNIRVISLFTIVVFSTGCAHKISISPDDSEIYSNNNANAVNSVGYYFPPNARNKVVVTPGGGADRVQYKPYKDIESALVKMLKNIFQSVTTLESNEDEKIYTEDLDYVMSLEVITDSSSPSSSFWPPTWFSVELNSEVFNLESNKKVEISVKGEGEAEFKFAGDKDVPGKIASRDALLKLQDELSNMLAGVDKNKVYKASKSATKEEDITIRLKKLKNVYDLNLITEDEYKEKKSQILNSL